MTIDKQKLHKLLWAEAASYRTDCAEWKHNTELLQEFLGEKTVEEVALELLAENQALIGGMTRIMRATHLGDPAFSIACEVVGELGHVTATAGGAR